MDIRYKNTILEIDRANSNDPNSIELNNKSIPKEIAFSNWHTVWVKKLDPTASEELLIAARGIHICRWTIPREDFPKNRSGYHKWRNSLKVFHAQKVAEIMAKNGYDIGAITNVRRLITKKDLNKNDSPSQTLEDALCLVFLEHQFEYLAGNENDESMIRILRRTWQKMSKKAQDIACKLDYSERCTKLLERAIATN